jgi:hypothetical protein
MPRPREVDDSAAPAPNRHNGQRDKAPLVDRLRTAIVRPGEPDRPSASTPADELTLEELEDVVRSADDKERLIGLIAAPLAAAIGILVISALIANDPAALLKDGQVNKLHVSVSLYESLAGVLLGLSVLMLGLAFFRKRMLLGIVMALYGLAIFNLHYWGFGVPFILAGAWLLVRAYRLQRALREATEGAAAGGTGRPSSRPQPSRRPQLSRTGSSRARGKRPKPHASSSRKR